MRKTPRIARLVFLVGLLQMSVSGGGPGSVSPVPQQVAAATTAQSHYRINAVFDPDQSTVTGSETLTWTNTTGEPLDELVFRLYPNAYYYDEGGLAVSNASVNSWPVAALLDTSGTVLSLPLTTPLPAGEQATVSLDFQLTIPTDSSGTFGVLSHATASDSWVLSDWYPILAVWEEEGGWYSQEPSDLGDPTYSEAAIYDLTLQTPAIFRLVATGEETVTANAAGETWTVNSGIARELSLVLDSDLSTSTTQADGTTISVHLASNPEDARTVAAERVLDWAAVSLQVLGDRYGAYPASELDLVEVDLADGVLGVSWAGVIYLDDSVFDNLAAATITSAETGRVVVAHEIGHQWWGNLVHANTNTHAFMVEGLTHYLAMVSIADANGAEIGAHLLRTQVAAPYLRSLKREGDAVANQPGEQFQIAGQRGAIIYGKAGLGFLAIRQAIGDDAFFAALRQFTADYSYEIAAPADLLAAFETASGQQLDDLWMEWFESATTTVAEVEALVAAAAA